MLCYIAEVIFKPWQSCSSSEGERSHIQNECISVGLFYVCLTHSLPVFELCKVKLSNKASKHQLLILLNPWFIVECGQPKSFL